MTAPQSHRLPRGGRIDRERPLAFTFDGQSLAGYAGDTLASALLANGVRVVARSFKYHRPRGVYAAGAEEPNAFVRLTSRSAANPMCARPSASWSTASPRSARTIGLRCGGTSAA